MASVRQAIGRVHSGNPRGDIFPLLGLFIGCGAVLSTIVGVAVSGGGSLLVQLAGSAGLGAILGLFLGLGRGVWHLGQTVQLPASVNAADQLWDPWLDNGREEIEIQPALGGPGPLPEEQLAPIEEKVGFPVAQVRIRPYVISPETGEAIRLDDEIGRLIQEGRNQYVTIVGGPGSGKSTALLHLTTILPPWALARVRLVDDAEENADNDASANNHDQVVISAATRPPAHTRGITYRLASWGQDDIIEYLLAAHGDRCASVMARLKAVGERYFVKGIPELWTVILDRMAQDESIPNVRTALRKALTAWFDEHPNASQITEDFCLHAVGENPSLVLNMPVSKLSCDPSQREQVATELLRLVRHRPVRILLAADRIAALVGRSRPSTALTRRFPRDLVHEAALLIGGNGLALEHLSGWVNRSDRPAVHPLAASLLNTVIPGWRPDPSCRPWLKGAYLDRAAWSRVNLTGVNLESADLSAANLNSAILERTQARQARFRRADLQGAVLNSCVAIRADLSEADLRTACAVRANLQRANLVRARLIGANLWKADLQQANIEDADFTDANLEDAVLKGLKLNLARFDGARFGGANLRDCDLEDMVLTAPDFHDVDLRGALLTASHMHEANFVGANLGGAGLAEIDWPGADLRDSDLRCATFHLGSSRNGLVGSPIACEGSRTGFYTDDYHDQDIKSAEEIRKANLRGADLRGAEIEGVDFYLVDLRNAKYTHDQAKHFRRCRAILEDRDG